MQRGIALTLATLTLAMLAQPRPLTAREAVEGSKLSLTLQHSGSDDDITGRADFRSQKGRTRFRLRLRHGPAEHELELYVGGVLRGVIATSRAGSANVVFALPPSGKARRLDFDPRGREIEIHDLNDDKLLTSDGASRTVDERANLVSTGAQPGASGHARLREKGGRREFSLEIEDVTDGAYDLLVDGVPRGTINVAGGRGEIEFGDDSSGLPLDFDPLGKLIQVSQNGSVILTGNLLAGAPGVNVCTPAETTIVLTNLGLDPDASGDARLRVDDDCEREFRVQIEDLPVGDYDLVVGGVARGAISVAVQPDMSVRGEIEFSSDPDDPDELPLEFDPAGQVVEVRQGATVFLSAQMPE